MMEKLFFSLALLTYCLSMGLYLTYALLRQEPMVRMAKNSLLGAIVFHAVSLLIRTYMGRLVDGLKIDSLEAHYAYAVQKTIFDGSDKKR